MDRHEDADRTPVQIEASDAIDAAGALTLLAEKSRRQGQGARHSRDRSRLLQQASIYEAAARRVQSAADRRFS